MKRTNISENAIRRLPGYLRLLEQLQQEGNVRTSSAELSQLANSSPSQVRQDLNYFGNFGQQGYGYEIQDLVNRLQEIIMGTAKLPMILVGTGNIGKALLENFDFSSCGFELIAAFDILPDAELSDSQGIPIWDSSLMEGVIRENHVTAAALCVPKEQALEMAEHLVALGVRGIWNFTNVGLESLGTGVVVENLHFSDSLMIMKYYMGQ